jgi:hypothetical protein
MGVVFMFAACFRCGAMFSSNPLKVPSVRDPKTGQKEPLCRPCVEWANTERAKRGLDTWSNLDEAYGAADEDELPMGGDDW